ncbi:DUF4824 family protein [Colwellia piezophila]|uniref:DUF4824 family protein n=1 Tax=Colwellia piezophila TaxID=211668 RepID=UPI00035ED62E|nr:DUF4824 family protein [Colwellia piezophila]
MKKYLLIGLTILIGTNIVALSGTAYNRMGGVTAQLMLSERELSLPYISRSKKENSGLSLAIIWRTPTGDSENYSRYNSKDIKIYQDELLALGFDQRDVKDNYWLESRELYWAFEFDGALHKAEIEKAAMKYQSALTTFQENPNDTTSRMKTEYNDNLEREKTTNSRLFFIEASADYETLAVQFSGQQNIVIVKGVAKPYYHSNDKDYSLMLRHLSVRNIMIPLEYTQILANFNKRDRRKINLPRYAVDINWGNRLEPWIVEVKSLSD